MTSRRSPDPPGSEGTPGGIGAGLRVRIRRAAGGDLDRIHEVETACYATPWSRRTFGTLLDRGGVVFLVAEVEREGHEEIVGHGVLWKVGGEAELANLAVLPGARGRGIGGALLDRLLGRARRGGVTAVFLEVRDSNGPARALYAGRGFRQVGVRRQYYDRPREDARILRVDLTRGVGRPTRYGPSSPDPGERND